MSVAKDIWQEIFEEAMDEFLRAGMPWVQAEELAERIANRELPNRLADKADEADYAMEARKDPLHAMFRDHNCAYCSSGATPCRQGSPTRCEYPRARNE